MAEHIILVVLVLAAIAMIACAMARLSKASQEAGFIMRRFRVCLPDGELINIDLECRQVARLELTRKVPAYRKLVGMEDSVTTFTIYEGVEWGHTYYVLEDEADESISCLANKFNTHARGLLYLRLRSLLDEDNLRKYMEFADEHDVKLPDA